jgi:hypothetical protein
MDTQTTAPPAEQTQPPDERFWIKYSPHHEMSISSLASLVWHTLAVVLMVVVAWFVASGSHDDMPIELVDYSGPGSGGTGTDAKMGQGSGLVEAATASDLPPDAKNPTEPLHDVTDLQISPKQLLDDVILDKDSQRELLKITEHGTQAMKQLAKLDKDMRKALLSGGTGSAGANGGTGGGDQGGNGNQPGSGGTINNKRVKRKLRWTITFNTQSGDDYLKQVQVLGAILAFHTPGGELKCVKDLTRRPAKLEDDNVQKMDRIFWIDDRRDSVEQLARAMGLEFVPDRIYALFPKSFEEELLKQELAFGHKTEDQIIETRFQVLMRGTGYTVIVTDQRTLQ